jgi:glycosyltransferase involved in cell wall biosynthesis
VRRDKEPGLEILRCYTYPAWHRSFLHRTVSFVSFMFSSFFVGLRVEAVDLIWGTSPPLFQGLTAWLLARLKGVPFLFEVRDLWPKFAVAVGVLRNPLIIKLSEWLERFLYRRADQVVINSPGFRQHVRARGAKQVELIPNGVDVSMFDPHADGGAFRAANGLGAGFLVLYAGAHGMSNDLSVVLETAERMEDHPDILFALVGDGKEKPALIAMAQERSLSNIRFLDPLAKEQIPQALAAADACIAILKPLEAYKMTYPNKVFDYLAAGRPVILAIDGVIRKVVEEAEAGIFVPPGDPEAMAQAILKLQANHELARKMGLSGRRYVQEHFDRPRQAALLARLMQKTIDQGD